MEPLTKKDLEYDLLIRYFIKKYGRKFYSIEDPYGTAAEGLMKAIKNYNPNKGCKFKTFAFMCMKKHFISVLEKSKRIKRGSMFEMVSLDAPLKETENLSLGDLIGEYETEEKEEVINYDKAMKLIKASISKKEYKIIELLVNRYNDKEISKIMNISCEEVSNIRMNLKFNSQLVEICVMLDVKKY